MISPVVILSILIGNANADPAVNQRIAAPCSVVREKANQYFEDHHFRTGAIAGDTDAGVSLGLTKDVLTPSGAPLLLNRSSIQRYTVHRHLSPMKSYTAFRLEGQVFLTPTSSTSCEASPHFDFSAFEYVWSLAGIDDGYRSVFTSNGTLERGYLDSLDALFGDAEKANR